MPISGRFAQILPVVIVEWKGSASTVWGGCAQCVLNTTNKPERPSPNGSQAEGRHHKGS
jgi:hypothetical protein